MAGLPQEKLCNKTFSIFSESVVLDKKIFPKMEKKLELIGALKMINMLALLRTKMSTLSFKVQTQFSVLNKQTDTVANIFPLFHRANKTRTSKVGAIFKAQKPQNLFSAKNFKFLIFRLSKNVA